MHTESRKSNMLRLLYHCLIAVCLAGSLMLLPLCCAGVTDYQYDTTSIPDYDYNATFDYTFYSNSSIEDLDIFIKEKESENETGALDVSQTDTVSTVSYPSKAFRTVYPNLLPMLILAAQQLLRLL